MAFAKAGDREELTKGVSGHRFAHPSWWTNLIGNFSFRGYFKGLNQEASSLLLIDKSERPRVLNRVIAV